MPVQGEHVSAIAQVSALSLKKPAAHAETLVSAPVLHVASAPSAEPATGVHTMQSLPTANRPGAHVDMHESDSVAVEPSVLNKPEEHAVALLSSAVVHVVRTAPDTGVHKMHSSAAPVPPSARKYPSAHVETRLSLAVVHVYVASTAAFATPPVHGVHVSATPAVL